MEGLSAQKAFKEQAVSLAQVIRSNHWPHTLHSWAN